MKALFKHSIQQPLCQNELSFWSSLRRWRLASGLWLKESHQRMRGASAFPVFAGSLSAIKKATSNYRTFAALILLFVVAPMSEVTHWILDFTQMHPLFQRSFPMMTWFEGQYWIDSDGIRHPGWFYMNIYHLLFQLGPHIQDVVLLTAVFLLMDEVDKQGKPDMRRWLLVIAMGYPFAKILWEIQISSNDEFHQIIPPLPFLLVGTQVAFFYLFVFDYLMGRHYHGVLGPLCRLEGLAKLKMPAAEKLERMERPIQELSNALR